MKVCILAIVACLLVSGCQTTAKGQYDLMNVKPAAGSEKLTKWQAVVQKTNVASIHQSYQSNSRRELVEAVNTAMNKYRFVSDKQNYGKEDYWASPKEFFANGGDCEDYAIAKYYALKKANVPVDDMRIVTVFDTKLRIHHTVLVVRDQNKQYVLDNQRKEVYLANDNDRYQTIFHVNENGFWIYPK